MTPAEYQDLNAAARRGGTFYAVGLVEHFSPAASAVASALHQGGPPAHLYHVVRSNPQGGRLGDVDVVTDLLMHDLDHACRFLPGRVSGVEVSVLGMGDEARCDHAAISLTFGRSGQADIILSRAMACPARTGTISRGDESFVMDLAKHAVTHHVRPSLNGASGAVHAPEPREMDVLPANPLYEEIQAFCFDAKAGAPSRSVSGEDIAPLLDIRWEVERKMADAPALTNAV
jgi:predicted dehydrogenase